MITMIVIGLWHGASVLWLTYGALQGIAMVIERTAERWRGGRAFATTPVKKAIAWALTFHFIVFTCIFIRAGTVETATLMLTGFGAQGLETVAHYGYIALAGAALTHFLPAGWFDRGFTAVTRSPTWSVGVFVGLIVGAVLIVTVGETPFIYFQF
jgi:hypothetical protein